MKTILAIDPGRSKCGVAVVRGDTENVVILARTICEVEDLSSTLSRYCSEHSPDVLVIGNGTNSKDIQKLVRTALPALPLLIVDERDTSLRAREKFWEVTPRRGWRRLLPSSLLDPGKPIDDFAAVVLAERALKVE
ncbi:MAG: pre-16S rRNA-processing nuclease YqgF [Fimbriimonadales bacterium]|nr:pre-16S rRNA-processing nuclease YqgF [Fimbriimonadales bacterium]